MAETATSVGKLLIQKEMLQCLLFKTGFTIINHLPIQNNKWFEPESHCFSPKAFPNVTFRVTSPSKSDNWRLKVLTAQLYMVDPTPRGHQWTITWTNQLTKQNGMRSRRIVGM